ncbi:DUF4360 domain-containing protein [Actinomadura chibensis]|uniref:DUF4360 domain-containing protein n=2 Tax=Actinomadura chibensis TaxID=392828 RepID=A0A5D0NIX3_9ACTN|nr:DUF4360 domain-containing protein [Actinomadura chibensis]TYB44318.1 DUF4360 domain-containing protein [Actinomadura chibensis]
MNAKRTAIVLAGVLGLPVLTATSATAAPAAAPDGVSIDVVTVNGSGCRPGTWSVDLSDDRTAFTVSYSDFVASAGGAAPPTDSRKNCQINLRVNAPSDYTYGITGLDHEGYARLREGASGTQLTNVYFQGDPTTRQIGNHQLQGWYRGRWEFQDRITPQQAVYKNCGEERNLNINTEVRVDAGSSDDARPSYLSMDSTHGSAKYLFAWKRCS